MVTEQFDRSYPELAVGVASRREGLSVILALGAASGREVLIWNRCFIYAVL
ncbi:hypothetical protein [Nostoc sp.]|uniref:hypothetical protein n=1 Tax=Nostoc sp. TaxID=1180 RepID=UPI002FFA939B